MVKLSVNVNKVATLRNSRGGSIPSVLQAVGVCLDAGAPGITVHPRADERHIRPQDVVAIAALVGASKRAGRSAAEFNIEGDPREDLLDLILRVTPDQCTLVPVAPHEVTSQAGWDPARGSERLPAVIGRLQSAGIRVSVFIDPTEPSVRWAAGVGADRVELYTEPFARAFAQGADAGRSSFETYRSAAILAQSLGLGVNAGHDLDLDNLVLFRTLPHLAEVSIGHALISHALWVGLDRAVREYLDVLSA
jgi:pyridoxine 5-phosphate synthase